MAFACNVDTVSFAATSVLRLVDSHSIVESDCTSYMFHRVFSSQESLRCFWHEESLYSHLPSSGDSSWYVFSNASHCRFGAARNWTRAYFLSSLSVGFADTIPARTQPARYLSMTHWIWLGPIRSPSLPSGIFIT